MIPETDFLERVKQKILTPQQWLQRCFARDENNAVRNGFDGDACKFCLVGAIRNVATEVIRETGHCEHSNFDNAVGLSNYISCLVYRALKTTRFKGYTPSEYNDSPQVVHQDVLSMIDYTIQLVDDEAIL